MNKPRTLREFAVETTPDQNGFYSIAENGERVCDTATLDSEQVSINLSVLTGFPEHQFQLIEELPHVHRYELQC